MGKGFFNKHKHKKNKKFFHGLTNVALGGGFAPPFVVNEMKGLTDPYSTFKTMKQERGTEKGKKLGTKLETAGSILSTIGTLTEQPEISMVGTGLTVAGGYEKGESSGEIIGEAAGSYLGGKYLGGGGKMGQLVASQVGGKIGGKIGEQVLDKGSGGGKPQQPNRQGRPLQPQPQAQGIVAGDDVIMSQDMAKRVGGMFGRGESRQAIENASDSSHNDNLKMFIGEKGHKKDKDDHHNSVLLPNDLQAQGGAKSGVGEATAKETHNEAKDNVEQLEEQLEKVEEQDSSEKVLGFLVNNLGTIEHLAKADQNELLDEVISSGIMTDFFKTMMSQA